MRQRLERSKRRRDRLIFVVGPTAIGKTRIAVKVAGRIGGEIVSCDSMQVYEGMSILSQAPTAVQKLRAKHHLINFLDPRKEFSVAAFRKRAIAAIEDILRRGKVPIITGGTGLYAKALIDGLFPSPKADPAFRRRQERFASRYGNRKLYARLEKIDPESALKIHPNDIRRMIRALEICHSTGRTMTELKSTTRGIADKYDISIFGLIMPREKIYAAIGKRVERMSADGILAEVKRLKRIKLSKTAKAVLGLKEIEGYLDGEYDLGAALELLKMNTRRFAKRQLTWFRADKRIRWFDMNKMKEAVVINKIAGEVR